MATERNKTKVRGEILRTIAEMMVAGEMSPVTATAEMLGGTYGRDYVFKVARTAGFNVMKRNGLWYENKHKIVHL